MARGNYELEPDHLLQLVCPHCAEWFRKDLIDADHRECVVDKRHGSEVREIFYCNSTTHKRVQLHDAAEIGNLNPWEEWKRDQLLSEMEHHEREVKRIQQELNDCYMWENGRGE